MIALDANLLVYAFRADAERHRRAREVVEDLASGPRAWAIPWPCLHEFFAVVTNRRAFQPPTPPHEALATLRALATRPRVNLLAEGPRHLDVLSELLTRSSMVGATVHDAKIAAICLSHGVTELWTADRDFSYFPALKTRNPLVA